MVINQFQTFKYPKMIIHYLAYSKQNNQEVDQMSALSMSEVILAVIIGTLAAIVYSLRVLILLERRVANMEMHIQGMARHVLSDEKKILNAVSRKRSPAKRKPAKRATKRRKR